MLERKKIYGLLILNCFLSLSIVTAQDKGIFLKNLNYVDVETGDVVKNTNIEIYNGKIQTIGKKINPRTDAAIIEASGQWLIPGLVDAHIHLFQSGGVYTRPDVIDLRYLRSYETERQWLQDHADEILQIYIRAGITSVIDVGGPLYNFDIRDKFNQTNKSPNISLTGPLISTFQPPEFDIENPPIIKAKSAAEAIQLVRDQLPYKPDFIKIWYITLPTQSAESTYDIVKATIAESHKHKLKVAVHATELNTAKLALKAGADFLVHSIDDPADEDFVKLLKTNNAIYIPTLMVHEKYVQSMTGQLQLSDEDFKFAHPIPLGSLFDYKHLADSAFLKYQQYAPYLNKTLQRQDSIRKANLKYLVAQGVTIATGTDAGNIGTLHASAYFEEIRQMKMAGLSNLDILRASTINGAKVLQKEQETGSIKKGKQADLVLLKNNPLTNLDILKNPIAVIKSGQLFYPDSLAFSTPAMLAQQQLNAYNARNIEAFLAPYSDDVEIYTFPNTLKSKGKEKMRETYESMFNRVPNLHCKLVNRIVEGNQVIDQEEISGFGDKVFGAVAVYKIEKGKIAKVYFMQQ